jgi:hypothetical protein
MRCDAPLTAAREANSTFSPVFVGTQPGSPGRGSLPARIWLGTNFRRAGWLGRSELREALKHGVDEGDVEALLGCGW